MGNKNQGEGDYESARRYNAKLKQTVAKGVPKPKPGDSAQQAADKRAEQSGKARAKHPEQDAVDAVVMRKLQSGKKKAAARR